MQQGRGHGHQRLQIPIQPISQKVNEQVDRIIALLLGSSFKGTFTVTELVKKHQYPQATDDEVFDWEIDNY